MNKTICFLYFIFQTLISFSQGINNLWLMGYGGAAVSLPFGGTNIDFNSGSPNIYHSVRNMSFSKTCAVICDTNGNLLFYTNGVYVANSLNDTMLNGGGLNPSAYTTSYSNDGLSISQADLIIPFPGDSMKYYLFHVTIDDGFFLTYYLHSSLIDMSLDNGHGAVVNKNDTILSDVLIPGQLTACKHANGRDWWIACHQYNTNKYFMFLITPDGINGPYTQNIGQVMDINSGIAQTVFSPDGLRFALYDAGRDLDILDFNRCTGIFSNCIHIPINDSASANGVAFSSNSKVLYVSSTKYVYQFDLTSSNIPSTQTTVATWDNFYFPGPPFATTFYLSQLAPDKKIYISCGNGTPYLHVINHPDSIGQTCDVCQHCVQLPTYNAFTIPNHPNYFLGADTGSICDSLRLTVSPVLSNIESIIVFPNPTTHILYAALNKFVKVKDVKVFNVLDQEMHAPFSFLKNGEYIEVNTEELLPGIYFLKIFSDKGKVVKKFVKR